MTGPQGDLLSRTSAPRPVTQTCAADLLYCGAIPNQRGRVGSHRVALQLTARVSRLQFQFQVKCHKRSWSRTWHAARLGRARHGAALWAPGIRAARVKGDHMLKSIPGRLRARWHGILGATAVHSSVRRCQRARRGHQDRRHWGGLGNDATVAEAYVKSHPSTKIAVLPSLGSGGGIKAVLSGALQLGLSSRPLTEAEVKAGAVGIEYGRTPFVFATSATRKKAASPRRTWSTSMPARLSSGRMARRFVLCYVRSETPTAN